MAIGDGAGTPIDPATVDQAYDEMVTGAGGLRRHWSSLIGVLTALPEGGLAERMAAAHDQFARDGVSYRVPGDPREVVRPWSFDLVPLLIGAEEWSELEAGLVQRATLINAVLADLYGPQSLIAEGLVPPGLVFANPEFLRPCRGWNGGSTQPMLHLYAADLVRLPDGRWRVQADRTQAPTGLGYMLENRRVLSRALPEALDVLPVQPLLPFVELWQAGLEALAPPGTASPRIVLLSPGPSGEAYFEHIYLARELGITLVESGDLTVRDGAVHLKSLSGLRRVDVVLRRVDADQCDPLELRPDGSSGAAGLLQAVRSEQAAISNALGAGLGETPALPALLPGLCRRLLGERLRLESVPTWWCGDPAARAFVLDHLDDMVLRPTFAVGDLPTLPRELPAEGRQQVHDRLTRSPGDLVAQSRHAASIAPFWTVDDGLQPRPVVVRVFLVATGEGYRAIPGGLARVPGDADPFKISMQQGGTAKDVWIVAEERAGIVVPGRGRPRAVPAIRQSEGDLLSRVADDIYWMGRYVERIDIGARLLRAGLGRLTGGGPGARASVELSAISDVLARLGMIDAAVSGASSASGIQSRSLIGAAAASKPFRRLFAATDTLADSVRDRLSTDMWTALTGLLTDGPQLLDAAGRRLGQLMDALDRILRMTAAVAGNAAEAMTRGTGWHFHDLGRRIERAIYVCRVVRAAPRARQAYDDAALRLILELCDSAITYRTRYMAELSGFAVLHLVLADRGNPRSLAFNWATADAHLSALPPTGPETLDKARMALSSRVRDALAPFEQERQGDPEPQVLGTALPEVEASLMTFSETLAGIYFAHIPALQTVGIARSAA